MNPLFIELYLDEDVDILIADLLRARGFKVMTTQEAGRLGKDDDGDVVSINRNEVIFKQVVENPTASKPFREVIKGLRGG